MTGWYWKQTRWNEFKLTGPAGEVEYFTSYHTLFNYCAKRGIEATQV